MNKMCQNPTRWIASLVLLLAFTGCSVVKGAPDSTKEAIMELSDWHQRSADKKGDAAYRTVQSRVNSWIDGKVSEIEVAATSLTDQVDITRDQEMVSKVNTFLGPKLAPIGVGDIIKGILDWLVGEYKKGREAEAAATSKALKDYKWPN